jgi:tetratricopeptide (TPR) repeat protein
MVRVVNSANLSQVQDLLKQGELTLAEVLCHQLVDRHPQDIQVLVLMGLIVARNGDMPKALQFFLKARDIGPGQSTLHFRLGAIYQELGQDSEASASFSQAIKLQPDNAIALHAQGLSLKRLGRFDEALKSYDQALELAPNVAEAWNNRAVVLRLLGRLNEAVESYNNALALNPKSVEIRNNLGYTLHCLGCFDAALEHYGRALQLRPRDVDVLNNQGMAFSELGLYADAIAAYEKAMKIEPRSWQTLMNLGVTQYEQKQFELALRTFDQVEAIMPGNLDLQINRGNSLQELGRLDEALEVYRVVLTVRPQDAELQMNIGNVYREMQRHETALNYYDSALSIDADNAEVHWNRSLSLLAMGDYVQGWSEYEWRTKTRKLGRIKRDFMAPKWCGKESISGKTILLHAEQGLGDTLLMCRYAAVVAALGARVVLEVQRPVVGLLKGIEGVAVLLAQGDELPYFDFHCPLMSLPFVLNTTTDKVPAKVPYITPDSELVERWRNEFDIGRMKVGVAWAGNASFAADHKRSLTLAAFLEGLPDGPQYYCLQESVADKDNELFNSSGKIQRFDQNDFRNTAAQICLMDVVVSVDTSIAQLAAALGCKVWVMLAYSADFRWLVNRTDSIWNPTARLFRQPEPNNWTPVMATLKRELECAQQEILRK